VSACCAGPPADWTSGPVAGPRGPACSLEAGSAAVAAAVELWWLIEANACGMQRRFGTGFRKKAEIRNYQTEIRTN